MAEGNEVSLAAIGRVRKLRQARGLSAQGLVDLVQAQGVPITRAVVANMESGRRAVMTVDELCALAEVLGSTPEGLLGSAPLCGTCRGEPPAGFSCLNCGESGATA